MMGNRFTVILLIFLCGCAWYKELQPIPEIIPSEGNYQSIKNKDSDFILEKGNKYFIKFPRPAKNDYYLVLLGLKKPFIYTNMENYFNAEAETVLTRSFGFKEGGIQKIPDENTQCDTISLYPIDSLSAYYTWKIDTVKQDYELSMMYRYVYQWRYVFENNYGRFKLVFTNNKVDRSIYNSIDQDFNYESIDFSNSIKSIFPCKNKIHTMRGELFKLENIFPSDIKQQSIDTAYTTYTEFCSRVDDELIFQSNYLDLLGTLQKEKTTQGSTVLLLRSAPEFTRFISGMKSYPTPIVKNVKQIFSIRLNEVMPFYEAELKKNDLNEIGPYPELENAEALFQACDKRIPADYGNMRVFVRKFVEERDAFKMIENNIADLNAMAENVNDRPTESFYKTLMDVLAQTKIIIPECESHRIEKYGKYKCSVILDQKINNVRGFINIIAENVNALQYLERKLFVVNKELESKSKWPSDSFYTVILSDLDEAKNSIPKQATQRIDAYSESKIAIWSSKRLTNISKQIIELLPRVQRAAMIVPQINALRINDNYSGIIKLLGANRNISFLLAQYYDIDSLSLYTQSKMITNHLNTNAWANAESKIEELAKDKEYLNYNSVLEKKNQLVKQHENELFQKVNQFSRSAAGTFISKNISVYNNVPALYKDSAFIPVYILKYSTISQKDLVQRNKQIEKGLYDIKNIQFPEAAIKMLYKELMQSSQDQGVQKARAIVDHGKLYKGFDKQVKGIVDECDYSIPKSIIKPSEYRKIFALPSTSNRKGSNDYILRLKLNIPSEAEFPVFDVNMTIPKELVDGDENTSWFNEISINKKPIKNEGRFHITAPNASNNYESQVSPVQIDKSVDNIFELKFKYAGFRVFEVSVMVQKPILRKN